jgi:hypothetical protein
MTKPTKDRFDDDDDGLLEDEPPPVDPGPCTIGGDEGDVTL